jgi:hypothetical protein
MIKKLKVASGTPNIANPSGARRVCQKPRGGNCSVLGVTSKRKKDWRR